MTIWTLHGTGRHTRDTWPTLHAIAQSWQAAWADPGGFHHNPIPHTPPATTHLWAWQPAHWLRVRVDGDHWWAALLTTDHTPHDLWNTHTDIDHVDITPLRHWNHNPDGTGDGRVSQYRGSTDVLNHHDWSELIPLLPATAQFLGHNTTLPPP